MNDIVVQYAVLWGMKIGSAIGLKERGIAEEMKAYDSMELLEIFTGWAEEYFNSDVEDSVEFFEMKLVDLMHE